MQINIFGRNIEITEGLRQAVNDKMNRLEKYFKPDTKATVTLSVEKGAQKAEVTIPVKGNIFRSEQSSSDMYVSIDLVEEIIEKQLKKYKTKLTDSHRDRSEAAFAESYMAEEYADSNEIIIERIKKFDVKPMDPEEACMQMELIGHTFYVFRNAKTDKINVVYKRKNGNYGLIEPEA